MDNELIRTDEEIEETAEEEVEETIERSGLGTGWAMLIGSGLTLAAIAAGKKAKEVWLKRKAKKEVVVDIDDAEFIDVTPSEQAEDENTESK